MLEIRFLHKIGGAVAVLALAAACITAAAGEDKNPLRPYTVSGERHGVSFFPAIGCRA